MRRTEIIAATVLAAFSLVTILVIIPNYVAGGGHSSDLSPAFMPYVASGIILVAATVHGLKRLVRAHPDDGEEAPLPAGSFLYLGSIAVTFVAAWIVTANFGYLIGGPVIVAGFMAMARARPIVVAGTAVVFPIAVWLFMEKLLGFPLP